MRVRSDALFAEKTLHYHAVGRVIAERWVDGAGVHSHFAYEYLYLDDGRLHVEPHPGALHGSGCSRYAACAAARHSTPPAP